MNYRGFHVQITQADDLLRYNRNINAPENVSGFRYEIFAADDPEGLVQLDTHDAALGYDISDLQKETGERVIRDYIDRNYWTIQSRKQESAKEHITQLLGRAIGWIGESQEGAELYDTLKEEIHMTDDEIRACGFGSLVPYFDRAEYAKTIADYLVEVGTENTTTGNWNVPVGALSIRYKMDLKNDPEMIDLIRDSLWEHHAEELSELEVGDEFDMMFYTNYCPYADDPEDDPEEEFRRAERQTNEMILAEDCAEVAVYAANAPEGCTAKERFENALSMLGADVIDTDVYHHEHEPVMGM